MTLHVHRFGPADGRPLLALHGLSGHGARFADLAGRLDGYRIIAPDLRGHGQSPVLPPWDLDRHVEDLLAVLDQYGLDRVPVVGHSLGGVLALRLANAAPDRVDRVALLDPGTGMEPGRAMAAADRMAVDISYADRAEAREDRIRNGWADVADALVEAELDAHLERRDDGRWHWRYCRPALIAVIGELSRPVPLPPAHVPTLLVVAGKAQVVQPAWRSACERAVTDLTVVELDCGHLVYYYRPAETAAHLATFLG
ncbi:MAG: alpha/beta hydrolase [Actinocatenispora sp.]